MTRTDLIAAADILRRLPNGTKIDLDDGSTLTKNGHFWSLTINCDAYGRRKIAGLNTAAAAKRINGRLF